MIKPNTDEATLAKMLAASNYPLTDAMAEAIAWYVNTKISEAVDDIIERIDKSGRHDPHY